MLSCPTRTTVRSVAETLGRNPIDVPMANEDDSGHVPIGLSNKCRTARIRGFAAQRFLDAHELVVLFDTLAAAG